MDIWTVVLIVLGSLCGLASLVMLVNLLLPEKNMRTNAVSIPLFDRGENPLWVDIGFKLVLIVFALFFWASLGFEYRKRHNKAAK